MEIDSTDNMVLFWCFSVFPLLDYEDRPQPATNGRWKSRLGSLRNAKNLIFVKTWYCGYFHLYNASEDRHNGPFWYGRTQLVLSTFSGTYMLSSTVQFAWGQNRVKNCTSEQPIHTQFNCAVYLSPKRSKKLYNYLNWRWDDVGRMI